MEQLEERRLLAITVDWTPLTGELIVTGTEGNDEIVFAQDSGNLVIHNASAQVIWDAETIPVGDVQSILVLGESVALETQDQGAGDRIDLSAVSTTNGYDVGLHGQVTLRGGAGNDSLTGGQFAEEFYGGIGDDHLIGGFGQDSLYGGAGRDQIKGGVGNDFADGGEGADYIQGEGGNDTLWGRADTEGDGAEGDTILGGDGDDTMYGADGSEGDLMGGEAGDDQLFGRGGNDTLDGGSGNNLLDGGAGNDTYQFDTSAYQSGTSATGTNQIIEAPSTATDTLHFGNYGAVITVDLTSTPSQVVATTGAGTLSIQLSSDTSIENVVGSQSGNTVTGNARPNSLLGGSGNDELLGGAGNDTLVGGAGDDTLNGGSDHDIYRFVGLNLGKATIEEVSGIDTLDFSEFGASIVLNLSQQVATSGSHLELHLDDPGDIENVLGTPFADEITGNTAANLIVDGLGDDILLGGDGNDTLKSTGGIDTLMGGVGDDDFEVQLTDATGLTDAEIDGGTGTNRVTVLSTTGDDDLELDWDAGYVLSNGLIDLRLSAIEQLEVRLQNAGNDEVTIYQVVGAGSLAVHVAGNSAGQDFLTVDASGASQPLTVEVDADSVTGMGPITVTYDQLNELAVITGTGNDEIEVDASLAASTHFVIDSGAGTDTVLAFGSSSGDTFIGDPDGDSFLYLAGNEANHATSYTLSNSEHIEISSAVHAANSATLTGRASVVDAFSGNATSSTLVGASSYSFTLANFRRIAVHGQFEDGDSIDFTATATADDIRALAQAGLIWVSPPSDQHEFRTNYYLHGSGISQVTVDGGLGNDRLVLVDAATDDRLTSPASGEVRFRQDPSTGSSFDYDFSGITTLEAMSVHGGQDASLTVAEAAAQGIALTRFGAWNDVSTHDVVAFSDAHLEQAIRNARGIPLGEPVRQEDLLGLTELYVDSNLVTSLSGLEYAENLRELHLLPSDYTATGLLTSTNALNPINGLDDLTSLSLVGVGLSSTALASLGDLPSLESLDVRYNGLMTLSTFSSLPSLESLNLAHNTIQTLASSSTFSNLAALETLDLRFNALGSGSSLSATAAVPSLTHLHLAGNDRPNVLSIAGLPIKLDLPPDGADRAATIPELAEALHYNPIAIYEYVLNNFEFQPYFGSLKGAVGAFRTREGNSWDLSSLLVDLLTEVDAVAPTGVSISTQLAKSTISLSPETVLAWTGFTNSLAAAYAFDLNGLYFDISDNGSEVTNFELHHSWAKLSITAHGGSQSYELDPTWKFKDYRDGVPGLLSQFPFDVLATGASTTLRDQFLSQPVSIDPDNWITDQVLDEWYEERVADYLMQTMPGASVSDVSRDGPIMAQHIDALPTTLPHTLTSGVVLHTPTPGEPTPESVNHKVKLTYSAQTQFDLQSALVELWSHELNVASIGQESITVQFPWVQPQSTVRPKLYVGSTEIVFQSVPAIPYGYKGQLKVEIIVPHDGIGVLETEADFDRPIGDIMAVGINADQISADLLHELRDSVNTAALAGATNPNNFTQQHIGELLSLAALSYFDRVNEANDIFDSLFHTAQMNAAVSVAVVSANPVITADNFFLTRNIQIPVVPRGMTIDVPILHDNSLALHTSPIAFSGVQDPKFVWDATGVELLRTRQLLTFYNASALEHAIWEELTNTQGMSSVKSILMANADSNNDVLELTGGMDEQVLDGLISNLAEPIQDNIRGKLNGQPGTFRIVVPEKHTNLYTEFGTTDPEDLVWSGVGMIVNDQSFVIVDQFGNSSHGGVANYSPTPVFPPPPNPNQSIVGDPINITNGAVYENVVDFSLPAIGGLPLRIQRHYDADSLVDRGMGRGWFHTYSHYLDFDPPDTPTGTVAWVDDHGRQHDFEPDGQGGYIVPQELRGEFWYDGTANIYIFRQKDGMTYKFAPDGRLFEIRERNHNVVELFYQAGVGQSWRLDSVWINRTQSDDHQGKLTFSYHSGTDRIETITDHTSRTWTYNYQSHGSEGVYLKEVIAPTTSPMLPVKSTYTYVSIPHAETATRKLDRVTRPDGSWVEHTYYPNGRGYQVIDQDGYVQTFLYDLYRNRTTFIDERGVRTIYSYDEDGYTTEILQEDRAKSVFTWEDGLLKQERDPYGLTQVYTHSTDGLGDVTSITVKDGTGQTVTVLEGGVPVSLVTTIEYQRKEPVTGEFVTVPSEITLPGGRVTTIGYDDLGNARFVTDPEGFVREYVYDTTTADRLGTLTATVDPRGLETPVGTDPFDYVTFFTYNDAGQVLTRDQWVRKEGGNDVFAEETFTYDSRGNLLTYEDAEGSITQYTYDLLGRELEMIAADPDPTQPLSAAERTWTQTYDAMGNVLTATDPLGRVTYFEYDQRQQLRQVIHPDESMEFFAYDGLKNLIYQTDALGRVTSVAYDSQNRPMEVTNPDGTSRRFRYDGRGLVVAATDERGHTTQYEYDLLGREVEMVDPLDGSTSYEYDTVGNVTAVTNARGARTEYEYDLLDRPIKRTDPDPDGGATRYVSSVWSYQHFDLASHWTRFDSNGRAYRYNVDGLDRVASEEVFLWNEGTEEFDLVTELFTTYDHVGSVLSETDIYGGVTQYEYDDLHRLVKVTEPDPDGALEPLASPVTQFEYDILGKRTALIDPLSRRTEYDFDIRDRLVEETLLDELDNTVAVSSLGYDAVGNVVNSTEAVDLVGMLGRTSWSTYDNRDRVVKAVDPHGFATHASYDAAGNVLSRTDARGFTTEFEYDALDRLTLTRNPLDQETIRRYDAVGNLLELETHTGAKTVYEYDLLDRVSRRTDPDPDLYPHLQTDGGQQAPVVAYEYDESSRLTHVFSFLAGGVLQRVNTYTYDVFDRRISETAWQWNAGTSEYDVVISSSTNYDDNARTRTEIDAEGNATLFQYDALGRLIERVDEDPDGAGGTLSSPIWQFEYDAVGNQTLAIDQRGNKTESTYDARNLVTLVRRLDGADADAEVQRTSYEYDAVGNRVSTTDALGRVTRGVYDALDRMTQSIDPLGFVTRTAYDPLGNVVEIFDARGTRTSFAYDQLNRELLAVEHLDASTAFATSTDYDDDLNVWRVTDARGATTEFENDQLGRLIRRTDPDPITGSPTGSLETKYQYDTVGNLKGIFSHPVAGVLVRATAFDYDSLDREVKESQYVWNGSEYVFQHQAETFYNDVGSVVRTVDPLGRETLFERDNLYRLTEQVEVDANDSNHTLVTGHVYDEAGNRVRTVDPEGRTTDFVYDALDRQIEERVIEIDLVTKEVLVDGQTGLPLVHSTWTSEYDAVGNLLESRTPLAQVTSYVYDALDRPVQVTDPRGMTQSTEYDALGLVERVIDPLGNITGYEYDALGRLVAQRRFDGLGDGVGAAQQYDYDQVGNLVEFRDERDFITTYEYDFAGRMTTEAWFIGSTVGTPLREIALDYNASDEITSVVDSGDGTGLGAHSYAFEYDGLGRRTESVVSGPLGLDDVTLSYQYWADGQRKQLQAEYADGPVQIHLDLLTDYSYDGFGRLSRLVRHGTSFSGHAYVDFGYNAASELDVIDRYRFTPTANPILTATTTYERDAVTGWLDSLIHAQDSTELARYDYTHDLAGRITSVATLDDSRTFDYDEDDQLVSVDHSGDLDEAYEYDENGNRVGGQYETGDHNRLLSDGTYDYDYDDAGNLLRRTTVATGESVEYDWDHRGRLTQITSLDAQQSPTNRIDYFYDYLDRRIAKAVDDTGTGEVDEAELTHFVYDGADVLLQLDDPDGAAGNAARVMHRYLHGPLVDQILLDNDSPAGVPATMDWLLTDHQGTPWDIARLNQTSGDTELVDQREYDTFGQLLTTPQVDTLHGYTGREWDADAELYFYAARWYDPATGRFLSEDPLAFAAGDPNLYRYVGNNVLNLVDPMGLFGMQVGGGASAGAGASASASVSANNFFTFGANASNNAGNHVRSNGSFSSGTVNVSSGVSANASFSTGVSTFTGVSTQGFVGFGAGASGSVGNGIRSREGINRGTVSSSASLSTGVSAQGFFAFGADASRNAGNVVRSLKSLNSGSASVSTSASMNMSRPIAQASGGVSLNPPSQPSAWESIVSFGQSVVDKVKAAASNVANTIADWIDGDEPEQVVAESMTADDLWWQGKLQGAEEWNKHHAALSSPGTHVDEFGVIRVGSQQTSSVGIAGGVFSEGGRRDIPRLAPGGGGVPFESAWQAATSNQFVQRVQSALDFIGILDPTPIADGINAAIYAFRGDYYNSGISMAGFIPVVGDVGKLARVNRQVLRAYDVGSANSFWARSVVGDNISIHHVGQAHAMEQLIPGYSRATGPAIAVPNIQHLQIPNLRGTVALTPRQVLARDIRNLRNYTDAPNSALQRAIELNKELYRKAFEK